MLRHWYDRIFRAELMRRIDESIEVILAPMTLLQFYGLHKPSLLSIHDIQQEYHPEFFSWKQRVRRWAPYRLSAFQACKVQASSHYIKDCLLEKFSFLEAGKICVIEEGVDFDTFSNAGDEKPEGLTELGAEEFIFYPAQLWPHKNHLLLVDALARYREKTGSEIACVLSGSDYGRWPAIQAYAQGMAWAVSTISDVSASRNCCGYIGIAALQSLHWECMSPVRYRSARALCLVNL